MQHLGNDHNLTMGVILCCSVVLGHGLGLRLTLMFGLGLIIRVWTLQKCLLNCRIHRSKMLWLII